MDKFLKRCFSLFLKESPTQKLVKSFEVGSYSHIEQGFSERSVRRFVFKSGLKSKQEFLLDEEVRIATQEVSCYIAYFG